MELDFHGCLAIRFDGGAPTLNTEFSKLCRFTVQFTGLAVSFTTHRHHLGAKSRGHVTHIRVSKDGICTTYETLRGKRFADFQNQLNKVCQLAPFGINCVVNSQTIFEFDAAIELSAEQGAVEFLLLPERPVRRTGSIQSETRSRFCDWVNDYDGRIRLVTSKNEVVGMPMCDPLVWKKGLRSYALIDARGKLKRLSYHTFGVSIGSRGILKSLSLLKQKTNLS